MGELTSYALGDLLMFAPDAYDRLFVRASALWPAALGLGLLVFARQGEPRVAVPGLFVAWLLVAYWFHHRLYAEINLAGDAFAGLFVAGALLLLPMLGDAGGGLRDRDRGVSRWPGMVLLVYALFLHPLVSTTGGRPTGAVELFGIAPDPTALATVGFALAGTSHWRWLALPVPLVWLLISALTGVVLDRPVVLLAPLLAILAVAATAWLGRRRFSGGAA